jgi:hypothetical protein
VRHLVGDLGVDPRHRARSAVPNAPIVSSEYHDVDSNDMSFLMAGRIAFKKAMEVAKPTLLEPIMAVEVTVPDEFAGSIVGDANSRRGRIQGMESNAGNTIVKAEVPMVEMLTYGADLISMTQGRGSFNMEMHHYDIAPEPLQEKVIEEAKAERGEVKEEDEYSVRRANQDPWPSRNSTRIPPSRPELRPSATSCCRVSALSSDFSPKEPRSHSSRGTAKSSRQGSTKSR